MIAKGHDFPQVTLVGVISADVSLNLPDFRSDERTFNLLTQVGGRAGRGKDPGELVIQTYAPQHYAIAAAAKQNYEIFYRHEIELRRDLNFPPFANIIKITLRSTSEAIVRDAASDLTKYLKKELKGKKTGMVGPAPGVIPRIRNRYIWNILIKTKDVLKTCNKLRSALKDYGRIRRTFVGVDVDPISM